MRTITGLSITSSGGTLAFDGSNFILVEINGLESPVVRLPRYNLPGASGAFISNALYGERALKIKGIVNAPDGSRTTLLANRTTLINTLAFQRDADNNLQPQTVTITLENGTVLTTQGYVDNAVSMGFTPDQVDHEDFLITMVCPDPNLYSTTQTSASVSLPVGGGTAVPTAIPISLAPSSGGSVVIGNAGSTTTYPTITLSAPLTNPYLTNRYTGEFLKLTLTMNVGDQNVIIDCANQKITQGANTITGVQSSDSTFWGLLTGNNTIGFSSSAGSGTATLTFFPSFLGI